MKKFLVLFDALFIMQTVFLIADDDRVWTKETHDIKYVQFSPDGTMIATTSDGQVLIHDVETKETLHEYNPILQSRFTPDGKYIVGYFNTNELIVIDVATWQRRTDIQPAPSNIRAFDFSKDGRKIIASYAEKYEYSIWDIESGQIEKTVQFPLEDSVNSLWAEIARIYYGKDDNSVILSVHRAVPYFKPPWYEIVSYTRIVSAETGEEKFKMDKWGMFKLSNNKNMIAEQYVDKNVSFRLVNSENWDEILTIPGLPNYVWDIAFSSDDKYVVYSGGNRIVIYDIQLKKAVYTYDDKTTYGPLSISKDDKYIVSGVGSLLVLLNGRFNSTDVNNELIINEIKTYPNPTNRNILNLNFGLLQSGPLKILLFDLTGRIVRNIENKFLDAGNQIYEIDLTGLTNGQYNLTIETINGKASHKILVNR